MSLGATTNVGYHGQAGPPTFHDSFTQAGDDAYTTGGGTTGLLAALRALRGDNRAIVSAWGIASNGKKCTYDPATDKLVCWVAAGTEEADGNLGAVVYTIYAVCK